MKNFKFELGSPVIDIIDKSEWIVVAQIRHITGCLQYTLFSRVNSNGDRNARWWVDENLLKYDTNGCHVHLDINTMKLECGHKGIPSIYPTSDGKSQCTDCANKMRGL